MYLKDKIDPTKPILIAGPTASGKSALALELAQAFGGVILNGDALQVYSNWQVLTARPDASDLAITDHQLYGHIAATGDYSVGHWLREIVPFVQDTDMPPPIIVGGTGLYFSSLTNGLANIPNVPNEVKASSGARLQEAGLAGLLDDLKCDPQTLARVDQQNPVRVQRAWEVLKSTGRGLADWQNETPAPILPLDQANAFVLDAPKPFLTPRIGQRFRQMLDQGALAECQQNMADWDPKRPSSKAIGAPELMAHLRGEMTLETAIETAEIATRQYAKRQRSWFRARMKAWQWLECPL